MINQKIAAQESLEQLVDFLFDEVQPIVTADRVGVSFVEGGGARLVAHYARAQYEPLLLRKGYAEALTRPVLATDPHDHDALFALAMVYGLRADYAALIEGHNIAFLSNARKAAILAQTLLKLAPDYADAHLAAGVAHYVVGSLIAPLLKVHGCNRRNMATSVLRRRHLQYGHPPPRRPHPS